MTGFIKRKLMWLYFEFRKQYIAIRSKIGKTGEGEHAV